MDHLGDVTFISNDPFRGGREFIKKKGCTPETEWESHIKEVEPFPLHTEKLPVRGVDRDVAKGRFNV